MSLRIRHLFIVMALLCSACLFAGCGETDDNPAPSSGNSEAAFPVGLINWGDSYTSLFTHETTGSLKVIQYGAEYAGYVGAMYYSFDQNGELFAAYYEFNQSGELDKVSAYRDIKNALTGEYGECEMMSQNDDSGKSAAAPSIDDVADGKASGCSDMWASVPAPEGMNVSAVLQLHENGIITLSFYRI